MFDIQKFYREAEAGNKIHTEEIVKYIKSFNYVIIWGVGNLGTALGIELLKQGVPISGYWDQRYETIKSCNGIPVYENFGENPRHHKDETLVICGIANGTHSHVGQVEELEIKGYNHCILGMFLYEGLVCHMTKDQPLNVLKCAGSSICNFNTCNKYVNILKSNLHKEDGIVIQVLEFIVSRRCTLDCIECGQRVGRIKREYPQKYIDYPLERIKQDIDIVMEHVDVVGTFSIIGGEPFIHPQLAEIIEHCLTKKNVAVISITTNGVCNMKEELLLKMKNERVKINFSNYTQSLNENQKMLFEKNVELVKKCGLNCNVATPVWGRVLDSVEINPNIEETHYADAKKNCPFGPSVSNGTFFACPVTELYDKLEEVDVSADQISLRRDCNFKEEFSRLLKQPYYETCKHRCGNQLIGEQVKPGVQMKDKKV
ncbi:MAG: radical SAM protein [Lachnospiraceae bacterium]